MQKSIFKIEVSIFKIFISIFFSLFFLFFLLLSTATKASSDFTLKNPAILLFDEATRALDSESEKLVQEALDRFMISRTTLIIAHRLSTVCKADLVAVIHHGSISELGTHKFLMAKGEDSYYSKLIRMQEAESAFSNARKSNVRYPALGLKYLVNPNPP